MVKKLYVSGESALISGQYEIVDSNGKKLSGREVTMVKGKKFPPIPNGQKFKLSDATKHK